MLFVSVDKIAVTEERGSYLQFLNLLINDSIFLLDESLKKIPELKEVEAEIANTADWNQRSPQERQDRLHHFRQQEHVRSHSRLNILRVIIELP